MLSDFDLHLLIIVIAPLLLAVTLHEVAHGYVAYRLGDPTAKIAGRLTLNPIKHLDIFGSILMPLALFLFKSPIMFGYAKPVPVRTANLRGIRDMRLVSSAGILANLSLAVLSAGIFRALLSSQSIWAGTAVHFFLMALLNMAAYSVLINIVLAVFNLVPIPPLDGSRIVVTLLPAHLRAPYMRIERYGMFIIIFLLLMTDSVGRFISLFVVPLTDFLLGKSF